MNGNIDNLSLLIVVFISYEMDWSIYSQRKKNVDEIQEKEKKNVFYY